MDTEKPNHSFRPPVMTPEAFFEHLRTTILTLKADRAWPDLAYFTRHKLSNMYDDYAEMITAVTGKDPRI
jgi:tetraacyldisaccharide-1-P 4'-kinase